jgi:transaldolase
MTLLFSRERYRQIAEAYVAALSERVDAGEDVSAIASVASFFVSRIDVQADERLPEGSPLRGRIAVANAKLAYADVFLPTHSGPAWERLAAAGANPQRPLWASTGGKNPAYSPTLYIDGLIGEHTVTTVPDATLDAFRDAPIPRPTASPSSTASTGRAPISPRWPRQAWTSTRSPPSWSAPACSSSPMRMRRCSKRSRASASASPCRRRRALLRPAVSARG